MIIALEGLPGAGKTTSASLLARRLNAQIACETTHDHPFLETVYDDARRYDLQVELGFLLLHNAGYRRLPRDELVVTDFSPVKDLLFAEMMLDGHDLALFVDVYQQLYAGHPIPDVVGYLDVPPELCLERVRDRLKRDPSRQFEAGLDLERLHQIREAYEPQLSELGDKVLRVEVHGGLTTKDVLAALATTLCPHLPDFAS